MRSVRLALVTSVTRAPPSAPPVRFQINQVSTLPNTASPRSAAALTPFTFSRIHCTFVPEKYVAGGSPVRSHRSRRLGSRARTIRSVRVSCHTIALYQGRPVFGFHTTVVSRWLVTPIATRSCPSMFPARSAPVITSFVRAAISTGSCSTHPGFGKICVCSI